jgi:hypothetical protein
MAALRIDHIRPILLGNLEALYIQMDKTLDISDSDMLDIAKSLPNIKELYLAPDPISLTSSAPKLTFQSLSFLAQYCPQLFSLSLYLDASPESNPGAPDYPGHSFRNLQDFNLGLSPCPNPSTAAIHISLSTRFCDPVIMSEFSESRGPFATGDYNHMRQQALKEAWDMVSDMTPVFRSWYHDIMSLRTLVLGLGGNLEPRTLSSDGTWEPQTR